MLAELDDGAIVVEITFKGLDFLVREVLKEAGDAIVLEPADAREAVLAAAERLLAPGAVSAPRPDRHVAGRGAGVPRARRRR